LTSSGWCNDDFPCVNENMRPKKQFYKVARAMRLTVTDYGRERAAILNNNNTNV